MQAEDYAAAQIDSSGTLRPVDVRRHTLMRANRQRLLARQPQSAVFEFLLDEATLHRAPGDLVAVTQFKTLTELAELPGVTVRVVPYRACLYPALEAGTFTILDFPDDHQLGRVPPSVHVVHSGEHRLLTTTTIVDRYKQWWETTAAAALDPRASLRLIVETADQWR